MNSPRDPDASTRNAAFITSAVCHATGIVQYYMIYDTVSAGERFAWQFGLLAVVSLAFSGLARVTRTSAPVILFLRLGMLFLIGYPLGDYLGIELTLLMALVVECALLLRPPHNLVAIAVVVAAAVLTQNVPSAFYQELPLISVHDGFSMAFYALVVGALAVGLAASRLREKSLRAQLLRMDAAVAQLSRANLGFQTHASHVEASALSAERKRVSREIHDGVGYSLTSLLMMMEAAAALSAGSPDRAREVLGMSITEARRCLEEMRAGVRELRTREPRMPVGLAAIADLTSAFATATGMRVRVEYGNAPQSFGEGIDAAIVRMVQEGMTNSFRHGMASEVRISLWISDGLLRVSVQDDGHGSEEGTEGVGLSGMRERIEALGGCLQTGNVPGGFRLVAEVPWR